MADFTTYDLLSHSPAPGPVFPVEVRLLNSAGRISVYTLEGAGWALGSRGLWLLDLLFYYSRKLKNASKPLKVPWIGKRPDFEVHYIFLLKLGCFVFIYSFTDLKELRKL